MNNCFVGIIDKLALINTVVFWVKWCNMTH